MAITKFYNNKYNIKLNDIIRGGDNTIVVTKNMPFTITVENKSTSNNNSNTFEKLTKDKVSLKLVYENDLSPVNTLKSSPIEYNTYLTNDVLTIETRILALSSQHENTLFRVIMYLDDKPIQTEVIRCVSKITNSVMNKESINNTSSSSSPSLNNSDIEFTNNNSNNNNNINNNSNNNSNNKHVTVKKTKLNNNNNNNNNKQQNLTKTIKKLKQLRKNDKNLISLLYQQNKLITSQLNSVTTIVNSLVLFHNQCKQHIQQSQQQQQQQSQQQSQPSPYEAPISTPSTPFYENNLNEDLYSHRQIQNQIQFQQHQDHQPSQQQQDQQLEFPIIDEQILKSVQVNESCFSYNSDCSSQLSEYSPSQPSHINSDVILLDSSCSSILSVQPQLHQQDSSIKNDNEVRQKLILNDTLINQNIYSPQTSSSSFTFDLDFNLLGSQSGLNSNHNADQVIF